MKSLFVGVLFISSVLVKPSGADDENSRRAREEYGHFLSDPRRDAWQLPDRVIQALALKSNEVVADIGADEGGYFARRFARYVSKVYVLNPLLQALETFKKEAPPNQETYLSQIDQLQLGGKPVDTVFLYDTLAAIPNRPVFFALLGFALHGQGRIVVIDFFKTSPPAGLPPNQRITESAVVAEMKAAGFRLTQSFNFLPVQFFLIFQR